MLCKHDERARLPQPPLMGSWYNGITSDLQSDDASSILVDSTVWLV